MSRTNSHSGARSNIDFTGSKSNTDYLADQLARNDNPLYGASCNGYNGRSRQIEFIENPTGISGENSGNVSNQHIINQNVTVNMNKLTQQQSNVVNNGFMLMQTAIKARR